MKWFLSAVLYGFFLATTALAKSDKAAPKQTTPPAPVPAVSSPVVPSPSPPWLQMDISPLEKEIVKQHLGDIREAQSKKSIPNKALPPGLAKKGVPATKLPPGWQKKNYSR